MDHYDPLIAPDPEWLATDEGQRIFLALNYHRSARVRLPNERLHAAIHVVVENQVAMGDELPVRRVLDRLQAEGLDRHDAIHAIASAVSEHMTDLLKRGTPYADDNEAYGIRLRRLTAKGWRRGD